MHKFSQLTTVLFDLDGTLLDTAPDFLHMLNMLLRARQKPEISLDVLRSVVSSGIEGMLEAAFQIDKNHKDYLSLREEFLTLCANNSTPLARPFPGIVRTLNALVDQGFAWGIVTNKPGFLTDLSLSQDNLLPKTLCVVSGDTLPYAKPHPAPLLHACKLLDRSPEECLFIGDANQDIVAGRAAGMHTLVALYGYIGVKENPHAWGATGVISHADEIMPLLGY